MAFHLTERDNLMIYKFVTYLADQGTQSNFLIFLFLNFWAMEDILTAFLLPFATSCSAKKNFFFFMLLKSRKTANLSKQILRKSDY